MRFNSVIIFSTLGAASIVLSGCIATTASQGAISLASASSSLRAVATNGHRFGASTTRYGEDAAIVVYSGAAQDFISCRTESSDNELSEKMSLDTRTKVVVDGKRMTAQTQYVATTLHTMRNGTKKAKSIAFGSTQSARFGFGVTCAATGKLEQSLFAQR